PRRIADAEAALVGVAPGERAFAQAAEIVSRVVDPMNDPHASADYRRDLVRTTTLRALDKALARQS
ncbi:MAG: xanthine dehydrogenase family protein subunit M, partial [Betaproteobacteria bacterium]|nr:xanthine dehydrogenase family protein subunit M [Betaproteobacteria bacterium]